MSALHSLREVLVLLLGLQEDLLIQMELLVVRVAEEVRHLSENGMVESGFDVEGSRGTFLLSVVLSLVDPAEVERQLPVPAENWVGALVISKGLGPVFSLSSVGGQVDARRGRNRLPAVSLE